MFPNSRFDQRTLKYFDKIFKFLKFKKERKNFAFLLKGKKFVYFENDLYRETGPN